MSSTTPLSAEQAAQAIILLSSNHATASGYMHSLNEQDVMSRSEFKEYLRTSSTEEYLDLLRGLLSDECATLAWKAVATQEKRAKSGSALVPLNFKQDTAERFFKILGFGASQGLHFKDVADAINSLAKPPEGRKQRREQKRQQKILEQQNARAAKKKDKAGLDGQNLVNESTANSVGVKSGESQDPSKSTEKTALTVTLDTTKGKKRKLEHNSPSAATEVNEASAAIAAPQELTRDQRRREKKRKAKPQATPDSTSHNNAAVNGVAQNVTTNQEESTDSKPAKKQKITHDGDNLTSGVAQSERSTLDATVEAKKARNQKGRDKKKARRGQKKRQADSAAAAAAAAKAHDDVQAAEDVHRPTGNPRRSVHEDDDMADAPPMPTQETTEFVTAIEPEDPFNDRASNSASESSDSEYADATEVFQPGRTSLPAIQAKIWKRSSEEAAPAVPDSPALPSGDITADIPDAVDVSELSTLKAPFTEDEREEGSDSGEDDAASDTAATSNDIIPKESPPASRSSSTERNGVKKPTTASSPVQPSFSAPSWLTSSQRPSVSRRSRSSLGPDYLAHASLADLQPIPVQPRLERVPSGPTRFDPQAGLKNLNKFLNNGNSDSESDDDDSDSSSSDGEEAVNLLESRANDGTSIEPLKDDGDSASNVLRRRAATPWPDNVRSASPESEVGSDTPFQDLAAREALRANDEALNGVSEGVSDDESLDLSMLPQSMDVGCYVPNFEGPTDDEVSRPPTGDSNAASSVDIDIVSPFKEDPVQESAQGIVQPSSSREASSSSTTSSPNAAMETDDIPPSSLGGSNQSNSGDSASKEEEEGDWRDHIFQSDEETDPSDVELERPTTMGSHNTEADQVAASSQLLGEEARQPYVRGPSPRVIIYVSPKKTTTETEIPVDDARSIASSVSGEDIESGSSDEDADEYEDEVNNAIPNKSSGYATKSNSPYDSDSDEETHDKIRYESDIDHANDDAPPDSPSSMEWNANTSDESDYEEKAKKARQPSASTTTSPRKRKTTGTTSKHFSASPEKKKTTIITTPKKPKRVAGVSSVPFPSLSAPRFGLIQETLCHNPFQMLLAVLFLNKTSGRVALDIISTVITTYPTPEALAAADTPTLVSMIGSLGLQNERARKLKKLASIFASDPPVPGRRHRVLHYPSRDDGKKTPDGKKSSPNQILEEADSKEIAGFIEIGHLYGLGPYAWDSWRIFCRDVFRGVADGFNGEGVPNHYFDNIETTLAEAFPTDPLPDHIRVVPTKVYERSGFEPEWKRVLPKDKELRAFLRWMWLREGWDWDPVTGTKKPATVGMIHVAERGEGVWNEAVGGDPHGVIGAAGASGSGANGSDGVGGSTEGSAVVDSPALNTRRRRSEKQKVETGSVVSDSWSGVSGH